MMLYGLALLAGFALLAWSADRFVDGAASLARLLGISPMVIGMTIVSLGTSSPEIVVAAIAASDGSPQLAIGNALGSNIANIGLVIGVTAMIMPLAVQSQTIRREFPVLLLVMLLALGLMLDGELGRADGLVLLAGLLVLFGWLILSGRRERPDILQEEFSDAIPVTDSMRQSVIWLLTGLLVLLLASRLVVWGAVNIAQAFGVSDLLIGLTIVAIGTSLPELMASMAGALKREPDIAIGNVLGSNMVNTLGVLCMPALIAPGPFDAAALLRDMPIMFGLTLMLMLMAFGRRGQGCISRFDGFVLLVCFCAYLGLLYAGGSTF